MSFNVSFYNAAQMDKKMHKLTTTGASPELVAETADIKVADNATGYALYHVSFTETNLAKVFQFTFTPAAPPTFAVVYYDGTHAIHMTASGNNYYFTIYDLATGQDLAAITVTNLIGCRIVSI